MTTTLDRLTTPGTVELRSVGGRPQARGYAAVWNSRSQDLGGFVEVIAPGAFRDVLRSDDVVALFNHQADHVLGRMSAGTLRLSEDAHGLRYEIDLPDTTTGRDVAALLERRDVIGSSFGFAVDPRSVEWERLPNGGRLRTVRRVATLRDVGPVTFPAYLASDASRAMAEAAAPSPLDAERLALIRAEVRYLGRLERQRDRAATLDERRAAQLAAYDADLAKYRRQAERLGITL